MKEKKLFGYDYTNRDDIKLLLYLMIGGTAALFEWGMFYLFHQALSDALRWPLFWAVQTATVLAFTLSTLFHYLLGNIFVFDSGSKYGRKKEISLVFLVSVMGLLWNMIIMFGFTSGLGWDPMLSKMLTSAIVVVWNYLARKKWIFAS